MVEVIEADLFSLKVDALAHVVSLRGDNIAPEFKKRFPDNYTEYLHEARSGRWPLGSATVFLENGQLIYNLIIMHAAYKHVLKALQRTRLNLRHREEARRKPVIKTLAIPSEIGRLEMVKQVFDDWQGVVFYCTNKDFTGL